VRVDNNLSWLKVKAIDGKEIGDLKKNVFAALEELGEGFLYHLRSRTLGAQARRRTKAARAHAKDDTALGSLLKKIENESLILTYRLLFLFCAEGRDLLPVDNESYREAHGLASILDEIIETQDKHETACKFSKDATILWESLQQLFQAVKEGSPGVVLSDKGGTLDQQELVETFKVGDYHLARAIDLLGRTQTTVGPASLTVRKKFSYNNLDIRHLGNTYESLLEYHADIAREQTVVFKRGAGNRTTEEYKSVSDLTTDELKQLKAYRQALEDDAENPHPPRGCKITKIIEQGKYYLVYGGRGSKRKSSGSYYTPDYIVEHIVEHTLGPIVRGECRHHLAPAQRGLEEASKRDVRPLTSSEILELKVLDPAMGSGHFLLAATDYLARAYGEACVREGKDGGVVMPDDCLLRYRRMVAEQCIYGIDINPMSVELAKLSMWLFTMHKGRPLSFLDHHFRTGNALVGGRIRDLGEPPEFLSKGKHEKRARKKENLFEVRFREALPLLLRDLFKMRERETLTSDDVRLKESLYRSVEELRQPFRNLADAWVGLHFGEEAKDYYALLLDAEGARVGKSVAADAYMAFHWELEFPEVWFDKEGSPLVSEGFSAVIGNPPYRTLALGRGQERDEQQLLDYLRFAYPLEAAYKSNLYPVFVGRSVKELAPHGRTSVIVPRAFLTSINYEPLRSFLLRRNLVSTIAVTDYEVFASADTGFSAVLCLGPNAKETVTVKAFDEQSAVTREIDLVERRDLLKIPGARIPFDPSGTKRVLEMIHASKPLSAFATFYNGIKTGNNAKFLADKKLSPQYKPVIRGTDIDRFRVEHGGTYVLFDPSRLWSNTDESKYLSAPKLILRQTSDRIVAAVDHHQYYTMDTTHLVIPNAEVDPYFLLGVLNSSTLGWYYRTLVAEQGKLFAEVKIALLKTLPIPKSPSDNLRKAISVLARKITDYLRERRPAMPEELMSELDLLVAEAYSLA
jgi:type I restriction-modification system DNA methylase subunit